MDCRCGLEADERTSVHFDEAVLEVTRGSLIRDDFESAKRAVKAASGASFSTKAKSAEWIGSKGWPSEEEFNALMKKVAYKVGLRTKVEAAKQRPSGDPSPAPATIDRLEIDYLNVAVGPQAVVGCKSTQVVIAKDNAQWTAYYPGVESHSSTFTGPISQRAAGLHCLRWLWEQRASFHLDANCPWDFEGACL